MEDSFVRRIETLIRDTGGQSALARKSGLSLGAIQRYLKGGEPTRGALMRLVEACGVSLQWLVFGNDDEKKLRSSVPLFGFAECGLQGWHNQKRQHINITLDWPDPDIFAVIAAGHSMAPEGIHPGYHCVVSPNTSPQKGDAILIRRHDGTATIKLYQREDERWIYVSGWLDPEKPGAVQSPYTDQISRKTIEQLAPVILVKRRL